MKKSLALVLALVMVLSSFSFVSAAPDFSDVAGTKYEDAVTRLELLNVLKGYPDGSFKPEGSITRAEFAAVAVRVKGLAAVAEASKGLPSGFSDVPAGHWAAGYVGVAGSVGIVNGIGGGLFAPNAPVKYEEAVTMLVRALGYEQDALSKGGYPYGYLIVAKEIDLLDSVAGVMGMPATRGMVAMLTDNALEIPMMVQVGFGSDAKWVVSGTREHGGDEVYLLDSMGFETIEGRVTSYDADDLEIVVAGEGTLEVSEGFDFYKVFGVTIKGWVDGDELIVYTMKDDVLFDAVEVTKAKTEIKLITADKKYDVDSDAIVYIDGVKESTSALIVPASPAPAMKLDFAKVVLNDDGDVVFVDSYNWDDFLVVEDVDGYDISAYSVELDVEDYLIVKGGMTISVDDLEEGDLFFYNSDAEFAEVFNKSTAGEITRIYTDRISVAGKDYNYEGSKWGETKYIDEKGDIASFDNSNYEDIIETMDEAGDVAVFVDRHNKMVFIDGDLSELVTTGRYVLMTKNATGFYDRSTRKWEVKGVDSTGAIVSYDISDSDWATTLTSMTETTTWGVGATSSAIVASRVYDVTFDRDGDITKIAKFDDADGVTFAASANIETTDRYIDGLRISSSTVVFLTEDWDGTSGDADDIVVTTWGELDFDLVKAGTYYVDGTTIPVIVISASDRSGEVTEYQAVVTAAPVKVSGSNVWRIKLAINGEAKTYYTEKDAYTTSTFPTLAAKDFVTVEIDDATDEIVTIVKIVDGRVVTAGAIQAINVGSKSLTTSMTTPEAIKLDTDVVILDATDSYKVLSSLTSLKVGDTVSALKVSSGSAYVKFIIRTAKVGTAAPVEPSAIDIEYTSGTAITVKNLPVATGYAVSVKKALTSEPVGTFVLTGDTTTATATMSGLTNGQVYTASVIKIADLSVAYSENFVAVLP